MINYFPAESIKLIFSGNDFFQTLEKVIDDAKEIIHFQTYIFEEDSTGTQIVNALIRAAKRNVKIFVLVDAYGSKELSIEFIRMIQENGIHFRFFSPLFSSESIYLGRRLHHKVIVIDKTISIVGGINIGDKYHGKSNMIAWLDYAVLIKGEMCTHLHNLCEALYKKKILKRLKKVEVSDRNGDKQSVVRFTRNDWIRGENEIYKSCLQSLTHAKKTIVIIASYFLPGYIYRRALKEARKRGVEIKVILAGKSDLPVLLYAEKYLYSFFVKNGIEIYEWPNSVMHGKAIIVDDEWVTIGSYNLNYLSHYRSIELNVEVKDVDFANSFLDHIEEITTRDCVKIDPNDVLYSLNIFSKTINAVSYYFYRAVMKIFLPKTKPDK
jgi:cardiolipin synthase